MLRCMVVQVDAAGFLTMTVLSARFAVALSGEGSAPWQSAALASCQHVLPLLIMAISLPWCAHPPSNLLSCAAMHLPCRTRKNNDINRDHWYIG